MKSSHIQIIKSCLNCVGAMVILSSSAQLCAREVQTKDFMQKFDKRYGQVEVGGRTVGIEFHKSWPTPSRISFYYPVANSIEFSNDYWKRDESKPFDIKLSVDDKELQLGREPFDYQYVPYSVNFSKSFVGYNVDFDYNFGDRLPVAVMKITIENTSAKKHDFALNMMLRTSIHTSHAYTLLDKADVSSTEDNQVHITDFNGEKGADNAVVFIANAGMEPIAATAAGKAGVEVKDPKAAFNYKESLLPGQTMEVIWLIGMCRHVEVADMVAKSRKEWRSNVKAMEKRVLDFVNINNFNVNDPVLMETARWSKAAIASLSHYIDGDYISMPCPAEYNFFFTHDLLVTGLGVGLFEPEFVRHGYDFLMKQVKEDNIIPHAYYWKDGKYVTEFCSSSGWNNLWFIISVASYLKHTNDIETVRKLFPVMTVSIDRMLTNRNKEGLLCTTLPDWWDAGNVPGARAYVSTLTYRALHDYVYAAITIGNTGDFLTKYPEVAKNIKMASGLLWDPEKQYLMNELTGGKMDEHYYIGSLIAPAYGLLDKEKSAQLLRTAEKELLDKNLGIRVAMPNDFDQLEDVYNLKDHEQGQPGYYFNGAIWPQGNIWYALSLIVVGEVEKAEEVIKKYITIDGIKNSPNGIPSFYETRITDEGSEKYGAIDKPTFLWQGGWYFYILYQLAGMRECPWNIYFVPEIPESFKNVSYELTLMGALCKVENKGFGKFFKEIKVDGKVSNSAVVTTPAKEIILVRGLPERPYLAAASGIVKGVDVKDGSLFVNMAGIKGKQAVLTVVSPLELDSVFVDGQKMMRDTVFSAESEGVYTYTLSIDFDSANLTVVITFQG